MVYLINILLFLKKGNWMATLDLQNAYFHITTHLSHGKFLHVAFGEDHYQYKALALASL